MALSQWEKCLVIEAMMKAWWKAAKDLVEKAVSTLTGDCWHLLRKSVGFGQRVMAKMVEKVALGLRRLVMLVTVEMEFDMGPRRLVRAFVSLIAMGSVFKRCKGNHMGSKWFLVRVTMVIIKRDLIQPNLTSQ